MTVFSAGVPEAAVDEQRNPRSAQQDVATTTAVSTGTGLSTTNLKPRR
jgi:hypothetical protein